MNNSVILCDKSSGKDHLQVEHRERLRKGFSEEPQLMTGWSYQGEWETSQTEGGVGTLPESQGRVRPPGTEGWRERRARVKSLKTSQAHHKRDVFRQTEENYKNILEENDIIQFSF